jgi:hypothetical protein
MVSTTIKNDDFRDCVLFGWHVGFSFDGKKSHQLSKQFIVVTICFSLNMTWSLGWVPLVYAQTNAKSPKFKTLIILKDVPHRT